MKIGHKIKKLRELKNLSQENMAEELSMSVTGYGKIERNEVDVNFEKLEKIAQVFGVRVEDIISFDEKNIFLFSNNETVQHSGLIHNHFPPELKQAYEDQISILKEEVAYLRKLLEKQLNS
jgi:transcriptional regulator with XRE-family HTH domain